jgi:uncharacterized protein (DUF983 family)
MLNYSYGTATDEEVYMSDPEPQKCPRCGDSLQFDWVKMAWVCEDCEAEYKDE